MRPQARDPRAGADRWLMSYADFVTVLFAFFTTLFAASVVDQSRMVPVASALQDAFAPPAETGATDAAGTALRPPIDSDDDLQRRLARDLGDAIAAGRLELIRDARGLVVTLPDDATFPTGSAEATADARVLIGRIGDTVRTAPNAIRIEGHTDDLPIRTARYQSNWELSTARASAVVAFMVNSVGIQADRLSAAGYGEFHPRVANDSDAGRARNRRVDVVILDASSPRERPAEPAAAEEIRAKS